MFYQVETYDFAKEQDVLNRLVSAFGNDLIISNPGVRVAQFFQLPARYQSLNDHIPLSKPDFYEKIHEVSDSGIIRIFPFYSDVPPELVKDFEAEALKQPDRYGLMRGEEIGQPFILEYLPPQAVRTAQSRRFFYVSALQTNAITDWSGYNRVWVEQKWRRFYFRDNAKDGIPRPQALVLEVSNACNLRCVKCPYFSPEAQEIPDSDWALRAKTMDVEFALSALAQWRDVEPKPTVFIAGDGEPLVHKQYRDIIAAASESGFPVSITTNGTLLDDETITFLTDHKVNAVISLDAVTEETFRKVVPGENFEKLRTRIENYVKQNRLVGGPPPGLAFLEMKGKNESEWEPFADYWLERGAHVKRMIEVPLDDFTAPFYVHDIPLPPEPLACNQPFLTLRLTTDGNAIPCCAEKDDTYSWEWPVEAAAMDGWNRTLKNFRDLLLTESPANPMCQDKNCTLWNGSLRHVKAENGIEVSIYQAMEQRHILEAHPDMELGSGG